MKTNEGLKIELSKLEEAAKSLVKYINENHHPHTYIIVTPTGAEVVEGKMSYVTEEFVLD